jgi:O-antigen ligase
VTAPTAARRVLAVATCVFLFLAPAAASAGLRMGFLTLAALTLLVLHGKRIGHELLRFPRALLVVYSFWALLALASLAWSVVPEYTCSELKPEVLYPALVLAVFFVAARDVALFRTWWIAIIAGSAAVILVHLAQEALPFPLSRHAMDGGPGAWSTHLVLIAPLLLALSWQPPWGLARGLALQAGAWALLFASAWETENRMVWMALAVEIAVAGAMWRWMPTMQSLDARGLRRLAIGAALVVAVAFGASVLERNERLYAKDPSYTSSIDRDVRPRIWQVAWREFRAAPWLGHGFGREILAERFLPETPRAFAHPELRHSHNAFSDIALELGVVGLATFLALLALLAREYAACLRDPRVAPLGLMGLMLLAGFVTKNMTDDFLYRHNALVFWALNGIFLGAARGARA